MTSIEGIKLDTTNEEFNYAVEFVQHTDKFLYLTGKAGTGKTTFLKYLVYLRKHPNPLNINM